jgi:hypothetical protein
MKKSVELLRVILLKGLPNPSMCYSCYNNHRYCIVVIKISFIIKCHIISSISGVLRLHAICFTKCPLLEYMQTVCKKLPISINIVCKIFDKHTTRTQHKTQYPSIVKHWGYCRKMILRN